jgi:hypothetical protein
MRLFSRPRTEGIKLLALLTRASERREEAICGFRAADDHYHQSLLQVRGGTVCVYRDCARAFEERAAALNALVVAHEAAQEAAHLYRQYAQENRRARINEGVP